MSTEQGGEPPEGLTATEYGMWQAFRNGSTYDLRAGEAALDDPHGGLPWGEERSVRARVVSLLLLHGPDPLPGRVSSLKLAGVQITDVLDLAGGTVEPYVELIGCRFEKEVLLPEARFTTLRLVDCSLPRLEAARVSTEGDLHLPRCRVHRGVRLTDAQIGTDLLLNQAVVHRDRRGTSLLGDGLSVGQDFQAEMMEAHGEVSLRGAQIGVSLSLRGSRLANPYGRRALNAPQLTVGRTLYLTPAGVGNPALTSGTTPARGTRVQRFECRGGVRLDDGRVGDAVDLDQARFVMEEYQELSLRRVQTPELRFLCERPAQGRVVLSGAKVGNLMDQTPSWPGPGGLAMGGFTYDNLVPRGRFTLAERLTWVEAATPSTTRSRTSCWRPCCGRRGGRGRPRGAPRQAAPPPRDPRPRRDGLGVPPGLDGGVRLPAGAGGAVDGGALGGQRPALRPDRPGADQGRRASAVELLALHPRPAAARHRSGPDRLLAPGRRVAVGDRPADPARLDPRHDGGGGGDAAAAPRLTPGAPGAYARPAVPQLAPHPLLYLLLTFLQATL